MSWKTTLKFSKREKEENYCAFKNVTNTHAYIHVQARML